jgi:hypothetical protein
MFVSAFPAFPALNVCLGALSAYRALNRCPALPALHSA